MDYDSGKRFVEKQTRPGFLLLKKEPTSNILIATSIAC